MAIKRNNERDKITYLIKGLAGVDSVVAVKLNNFKFFNSANGNCVAYAYMSLYL